MVWWQEDVGLNVQWVYVQRDSKDIYFSVSSIWRSVSETSAFRVGSLAVVTYYSELVS